MWKAVVKNVELRVELSLRQLSGFKAAFADNHRTTEPACDQQRLVPEIRHIAVRIHYSCAPRFPPITAREHVKLDAAVPQHLTEHNDERCFAGSARRNASHADDRRRQPMLSQNAAIIQMIANSDSTGIDYRERVHAGAALRSSVLSSASSRASVNAVAPRCDCSVSVARFPKASRSESSASRSIRSRFKFSACTTLTALVD